MLHMPASELNLKGLRVIIVSYAHRAKGRYTKLGGPALSLRDFLKHRVAELACIWQPLPISDDLRVFLEVFRKGFHQVEVSFPGIRCAKYQGKDISLLYFILKVRDLMSSFFLLVRIRRKFQVYIGVESHNTILGILLRWLRIVEKVIYYIMDYGERRFKNRLLNGVFHALDRFCVYHADCVWNLSPAMAEARRKRGIRMDRAAPQIVVPIGTEFERIDRTPREGVERKCVAYLGLLSENTGARLVIESMPRILAQVPNARLVIIGSGPLERELKTRTKTLGLDHAVDFLGLVEDDLEVERILVKCGVGLAPYYSDPNSIKRFTDPTKPKIYMACGLPVIITKVPPVAEEIGISQAGLVVRYDVSELTSAVVKLISSKEIHEEYRQNAIRLASKYSWANIFSEALRETIYGSANSSHRFIASETTQDEQSARSRHKILKHI